MLRRWRIDGRLQQRRLIPQFREGLRQQTLMRLLHLGGDAYIHQFQRQPCIGELPPLHLRLRKLHVQAENLGRAGGALFFLLFLQDTHGTAVFLGRQIGRPQLQDVVTQRFNLRREPVGIAEIGQQTQMQRDPSRQRILPLAPCFIDICQQFLRLRLNRGGFGRFGEPQQNTAKGQHGFGMIAQCVVHPFKPAQYFQLVPPAAPSL